MKSGWGVRGILTAFILLAGAGAAHAEINAEAVRLTSACLDAARYEDVVAKCTTVIESGKVNPTSVAVAYYQRGLAYAGKEEHDKAIADFTQTIKLRADYVSAYGARAQSWYSKNDFEKALADCQAVIAASPRDITANNLAGLANYNLQNYDAAIADFTKAIDLAPEVALFHFSRGDAYLAKNDKKRAKADYKQCVELDASAQPCKDALGKL